MQLPKDKEIMLEALLTESELSLHKQRAPDHSGTPEHWEALGMSETHYHNAAICITELHNKGYDVTAHLYRAADLHPIWLQHYEKALQDNHEA